LVYLLISAYQTYGLRGGQAVVPDSMWLFHLLLILVSLQNEYLIFKLILILDRCSFKWNAKFGEYGNLSTLKYNVFK